jgi:surface antigen
MRRNFRIAALAATIAASLGLGGCFATHEQAGVTAGAILGGVIGNQFGSGGGRVAATIAGAAIGGIVGGAIGRDLDETERRAAYEAQLVAVRSGRPERWNGRPGYSGYVEPGAAYQRAEGYCREYTHTIFIEGRPARGTGLACRQADGGWQIVS